MDKIREQYQAQKAEEEEKRLRFNSPHIVRHELEQSQEHTPSSEPRSSHRYAALKLISSATVAFGPDL